MGLGALYLVRKLSSPEWAMNGKTDTAEEEFQR